MDACDDPVPAVDGQNSLRRGLVRGATRAPQRALTRMLAGLFLDGFARGAAPDASRVEAAVLGRRPSTKSAVAHALGQRGLAGDVLAGEGTARPQRDRHADFVGARRLLTARYGHGLDFVWVCPRFESCPTTLMMCARCPVSSRACFRVLPSIAQAASFIPPRGVPGLPRPSQGPRVKTDQAIANNQVHAGRRRGPAHADRQCASGPAGPNHSPNPRAPYIRASRRVSRPPRGPAPLADDSVARAHGGSARIWSALSRILEAPVR